MNGNMLPHQHGEGNQALGLRRELERVESFQVVAEVFAQLADTTRLRIFWLLCHFETCVVNLSAMMDMSSPAVSHHLRLLKDAGLICSRREGKEVYYRAADTEQTELLHRMLERVMQITCPEDAALGGAHTAREIHAYLIAHLDKRVTIEELSKRFLMNPTSLKAAFKAAYGTSLAAHVKAHRMQKAAELLRQTELSGAEIAKRVGYESQSRFAAGFKEAYGVLPTEYRRRSEAGLALPELRLDANED